MTLRKKSTTLSAVRNEFLIRFYRWATADTLRQFSQGFPRLRNLRSGPAMKYLEFIDNLPQAERRRFILGKLKKSHLKAVVLLGESISTFEENLLRAFYGGHELKMSAVPIRAHVSSLSEVTFNDLKISNPDSYRIEKAVLRSKIEARLSSFLAWIIHDFASEKRKGALKD